MENCWMQTFPKGIGAMRIANSLVKDLNPGCPDDNTPRAHSRPIIV